MKPDGERIAQLEQHMIDQDHKLDRIVEDIKEVKNLIISIDGESDGYKILLEEHDRRLKKMEDQSNLWKWLSPSLSAIMGSVLTFLIIAYLTKAK